MKEGWKSATIGAHCRFENGDRGKNYPGRKAFVPTGIPFVNAGHLCEGKIDLSDMNYIPRDHFERLGSGKIQLGDILFCLRGSLGKYAVVDNLDEGAIASSLVIIRPNKNFSRSYLSYYFGSPLCFDEITKYANGAAQPNLSARSLAAFRIPLPPLEEQKRIVAILDEAFEGLDRARAYAEANLQNARELFDGWAAEVFGASTEEGTVDETRTVGDVCQIQSGAGFPKKFQGITSADYPFYKVSDMNLPGNEWELRSAVNYVSEDVREELGAKLFSKGAIVFPKVGGAILTNKKRIVAMAGCMDNNVMGLIPYQDKIVPEYLHEWLRSVSIYEFSNKANPPSITQATVRDWPLRTPTKELQTEIVGIAGNLRKKVEELISAYNARLHDIDDLRQSLLQKAFAGELTRREAA